MVEKLPDDNNDVDYLEEKMERGGYNNCKQNPGMISIRKIYINKTIN